MGTNPGTQHGVGCWFDRGADALAAVFRDTLPFWGYACPLCLRLFHPDEADALSVDHVPAEAMGGTKMVLTCSCNHRAGHGPQSHTIKRHKINAAMRGELGRPIPASIAWRRPDGSPGPRVNVELMMHERGPDGTPATEIVIVEKANDPRNVAELRALMDAAVGSTKWGLTLAFPKHRFHHQAALVGLLRDAYLVAFAYFGYKYILNPRLDKVRQQLSNPEQRVIPRFSMFYEDTDPADRELLAVREPHPAIVVRFGRHVIFLPSPEPEAGDIYEALMNSSPRETVARHLVLPWPTEPLHRWDLSPDATRGGEGAI